MSTERCSHGFTKCAICETSQWATEARRARKPWWVFDPDVETVQQCRDRRLQQMPLLSGAELEVLRKCKTATWDGDVPSKSARDSLYEKRLIVRFNGWQVVTLEGLACLETLGDLKA